MKVGGASGSGTVGGARTAGRPGVAGGFAPMGLEQAQGPAPMARTGPAAAVSTLDALIALQETPGPTERRKRAVVRAGRLLDALDSLKLGLLDGAPSTEAMERLQRLVREERAGAEGGPLQDLLDQIDTRAAVEIAKQEVARAA